ncbi:hypothetical protein DDE20_16715 [Pararhodobacter oceanensis]|uniref:Tripartite tricarboxylate transporter substrate-binding protein n=2 Tax=Pararhodobacter oceanensis TaxID=2172121 RepID=A0A2T8HQ77_9RHOB|nr:hypothetical protein DDE20_16715 [Pararhodobacter oceanensis]
MGFRFMKAATAGLMLALIGQSAMADDWTPSGPIDLMIAFRAGGGADTLGRALAEDLASSRGWEFIPQNLPGRGGAAMASELLTKPADGLTIGITVQPSVAYVPLVAQTPPYSVDDFTYLSTLAGSQTGLIARADRGWESLADVIAAARAGERISVGAMAPNLADGTYVIARNNDIELTSVTVQGGRGGLNGVVAGDLDVAWAAGIQAQGVEAGSLVSLASAETVPLPFSPDAPLLSEFGVPFTFGSRFLVIAPANLPQDAHTALAAAIEDVLNDPESRTAQFAQRAFGGTLVVQGEDLATLMRAATEEAQALIEATSE